MADQTRSPLEGCLVVAVLTVAILMAALGMAVMVDTVLERLEGVLGFMKKG